MQAAWQALQPMHLETSMSLATLVVSRTLGLGLVVAERRSISRDCSAIAGLLMPLPDRPGTP